MLAAPFVMREGIKVLFACAWSLSLASCGGSEGGNPGQPGQVPSPVDFSGRYVGSEQGTEGGSSFNTTLTANFNQDGNLVTGSYSNGLGASGPVNGTVENSTINFTGTNSTTGCTFSGNASLSGDRLTGAVASGGGSGCLTLNAAFSLTKQLNPLPPSPPGPPPPAGEVDWDTVTLTVTRVTVQQFRVDDNGNFLASSSGRSGELSEPELLRLDSLIDAIKEEAHNPFECGTSPIPIGSEGKISMTFENRSPADIYQTNVGQNQECWSGDYVSVLQLNKELAELQSKYAFG